MPKQTDAGWERYTLAEIVGELETATRNALGADVNLASGTPLNQLIGLLGAAVHRLDEGWTDVANASDISTSTGAHLDLQVKRIGMTRKSATHTVVSVAIVGTANSTINAGLQASTSAGDVFELQADVALDASGDGTGSFRAIDAGAVAAPADDLTHIVTPVANVSSVSNPSAGTLGENVESDANLRIRYFRQLNRNAQSSVAAIQSQVYTVDGVRKCLVVDNPTNADVTDRNVSIAARSIMALVSGGADADVARAIYDAKPAGAPTVGSTTQNITQDGDANITIRFQRITDVAASVSITLDTEADFPSDGFARIRTAVLAYFDGLQLGETPNLKQIEGLVYTVALNTATITASTLTRSGGGALGTADLDEQFTLASSDLTVNV